MNSLAICVSCRRECPLTTEFFYRETNKTRGGLGGTCKECAKARTREWYANNRERSYETHQKMRAKNPEWRKGERERGKKKMDAYQRAYYLKNAERIKERVRAYARANPEKIQDRCKAYYAANREDQKAKAKAWRDANYERVRASIAAYRT